MIRFFCEKLLQRSSPFPASHGFFTAFKLITSNFCSESSQSPTISYLQKSCGLSLESAISASKKLKLDASANPDLVLSLLRKHGLSGTHIKNLITSRPRILLADTDSTLKSNLEVFKTLGISGVTLAKMLTRESRVLDVDAKTTVEFFRENGLNDEQITTLTMKRPILYLYFAHKNFKPKLEFFRSLGFTELEVAYLLSKEPYVLERSLEKQIIPSVQAIRRVAGDDDNVRKVLKGSYRILEVHNLEKVLETNMLLLRKHGVPEFLVQKVFLLQPKTLLVNTGNLDRVIGKVKEMGLRPTNYLFMLAILGMAISNEALWERKLEAYRSFGLSNDDVLLAFKLQPMCMISSVIKIRKSLDFFVNRLHLGPSTISKNPNLILLSLEQRIIPRCSVLNILMSKGLIKEDFSLVHMLKMTKNVFEQKIIAKYQDIAPEIVEANQGKIEFQGFSKDLKM